MTLYSYPELKINGDGLLSFYDSINTHNGNAAIIHRCYNNNGTGFTFPGHYSFSWFAIYTAIPRFLRYEWELDQSKTDSSAKVLNEYRKFGDHPLITCEEKTDPPHHQIGNPVSKGDSISELKHTELSFKVTDECAEQILNAYDNSKIVVVCSDSEKTKVIDFKDRVNTLHSHLLPDLFAEINDRNITFSFDGFSGWNTDPGPVSRFGLAQIGMQKLQTIEQVLGLALAIAEYGNNQIPDSEIWFLYIDDSNYINFNHNLNRTRDLVCLKKIHNPRYHEEPKTDTGLTPW